jgi:hypothetical protein
LRKVALVLVRFGMEAEVEEEVVAMEERKSSDTKQKGGIEQNDSLSQGTVHI